MNSMEEKKEESHRSGVHDNEDGSGHETVDIQEDVAMNEERNESLLTTTSDAEEDTVPLEPLSTKEQPQTVPPATCRPRKRRFVFLKVLVRMVVIDLPLLLLFVGFVTSWCVHRIHDEYFVPFFKAAAVSDERLTNEHTYYDRMCSHLDLTTLNLSDIVMDIGKSQPRDLVDTMMTHGSVVVPQLLQPATIKTLRKFVVRRNDEIWDRGEAYPVSQGYRRASFGIDAAEDPIVAVALREIATNTLLQPAAAKLVGPDPAVAEITAITAYEGCYEQAWHSDVKIDGNAVKFARTFTHSYSLFVPLQDTTADMGATELCPGTHYCANEYLGNLCDQYAMQANTASPDGIWHAGDGVLLSQQVWHRGHAHVDPKAPERIVFIVTFISRPQPGRDHRQLSRGTYFHLKWNMWGHTWQDMLDAGKSMAKPYSVLRCLGLWKPKRRNWGFDLFTSSVMRIANFQGGFDPEDIHGFVQNVIEKILHLPRFLHGPVLNDGDAWQVFLQSTIDKTYSFFRLVNLVVLPVYVASVVLLYWLGVGRAGQKKLVPPALMRTAKWNGFVFFLGYLLVRHVSNSEWGVNIKRGRTLTPSFPIRDNDIARTFSGPTTYPESSDVLVGSRFDGKYLWAFNRWLDYHPGNRKFRYQVSDMAHVHAMYKHNPIFSDFIVNQIVHKVGGTRFLQQDYESGHWIVMSDDQAQDFTKRALVALANPILATVDEALKFLLADYRFGFHRGTRLAKESQTDLLSLRDLLYGIKGQEQTGKTVVVHGTIVSQDPRTSGAWIPKTQLIPFNRDFGSIPRIHQRLTVVEERLASDLNVGDTVWGNWNGEGFWFQATVAHVEDDDSFELSYHDGSFEEDKPRDLIVKHVPLQSGDRVMVNHRGDSWFIATVLRVGPDRDIDVIYDDGEVHRNIHHRYYRDGLGMFADVVLYDPEEDRYD